MPYKNKEDRNANNRKKYARFRAEDPEWVAKQKAKAAEYYQKKKAADEAWDERRKADTRRWYAEHGKENARDRKGYKPLEEYLTECDTKRKSRAEYMREWSKTEKGQRNKTAQSIKKRCGLTIDEYDAIYDAQEGKCRICGLQKNRYGQDRLVVDHCHTSGKFRALLCIKCNAAIGLFQENETILNGAIEYLRWVQTLKEE